MCHGTRVQSYEDWVCISCCCSFSCSVLRVTTADHMVSMFLFVRFLSLNMQSYFLCPNTIWVSLTDTEVVFFPWEQKETLHVQSVYKWLPLCDTCRLSHSHFVKLSRKWIPDTECNILMLWFLLILLLLKSSLLQSKLRCIIREGIYYSFLHEWLCCWTQHILLCI